MEVADIMLQINSGESRNIIPKFDVTPAEVVVLRAIHGIASVTNIKIKSVTNDGKDISRRSHVWERSRLISRYQRAPGAMQSLEGSFNGGSPETFDASYRNLVTHLFPGVNPILPIKFKDIEQVTVQDDGGINIDDGSGDVQVGVATDQENSPKPEQEELEHDRESGDIQAEAQAEQEAASQSEGAPSSKPAVRPRRRRASAE